jgi:hypothetical protein
MTADPSSSLAALAAAWDDTPAGHRRVFDAFDAAFRRDPFLVAHREHVERNQLGFGYAAFHHFWHLVAEDMPPHGKFLEVGVWKGQSVVAVGRCLARLNKPGVVFGLSPYDGKGILGTPEDHLPVVLAEWSKWASPVRGDNAVWFVPLVADSQTPDARYMATGHAPYDAVYVDGDHGYAASRHDLLTYGAMVRPGGLLIADDTASFMNVPHDPYWYRGEEGCSRAVDEMLPPKTPNAEWTHVGLIGHMRVWRRAG